MVEIKMNRKEAEKIVSEVYEGMDGKYFVKALEKLGLLKLEEGKTDYQVIQEVVGYDPLVRDTAQLVIDNLALNGYEIRKKDDV